MIRHAFPVAALASAIACGGGGGGSPTQSTSVVVSWNQTGHVVATNTQTPVPGAHVTTAAASADTNANGDFTLTAAAAPTSSQAVTVSAAGYITHETTMRLPRTNPVNLDLISTAAPFDQTFYDALARGASNGNAYTLSRWDHQMTFYIRTTDENGRPLAGAEMDTIRRGIQVGVQFYTNNMYKPQIEEGTDNKNGVAGYVMVLPMRTIPSGDYCSTNSNVGGDPSTLDLRLDACGCRNVSIPIAEVIHAVGHAVGMYDVAAEGNLMYNTVPDGCQDLVPTTKEQYHAALIYSRPRGNEQPDKDPFTFALSTSSNSAGGYAPPLQRRR